MWQSRKFRVLVYDAVVAIITLVATQFLAPDYADLVLTVIGILQAPVLFVIGGIAYEDGQAKRGGNFPQ